MKLAVVGSREFSDYNLLEEHIMKNYPTVTTIVSGGAKGADTYAELYAKKFGLHTEIEKPNWNLYGKSAGAIRNKAIVESSDMILAFWDGESKGTKITIDMAIKSGKPYQIVMYK